MIDVQTAGRARVWRMFAALLLSAIFLVQDGIAQSYNQQSFEAARRRAEQEIERRRDLARRAATVRSERSDGVIAYKTPDGGIVLMNRHGSSRAPSRYLRPEMRARYERHSPSSRYSTRRELPPVERVDITDIAELVSHYAKTYGLEENLIYAVIKAESNFNRNAVSPAGAQGLMQLMPGTAGDMGVTNSFDVAENIAGGSRYLAMMLNEFNGVLSLALAGYNAGPEAVRKYGGIPPYNETQNYVVTVRSLLRHYNTYGVDPNYMVKANTTERPKTKLASNDEDSAAKRYMVRFHSGLSQPAETVLSEAPEDPYYYIQFQGVTRRIRKDRVKEIIEPA